MQSNYNKIKTTARTALVAGLVGFMVLVGSGCDSASRIERSKKIYTDVSKKYPFFSCLSTDSDPELQKFLDTICKRQITDAGYELEEDFRLQGGKLCEALRKDHLARINPPKYNSQNSGREGYNPNNNGNSPIDRATGNTMGNLSTQGWINFFNNVRR